MHVGVGVLLEQIDVALQRIVDLDFDAGFGFVLPGMRAGLICEGDAEIVNTVEVAGEGLTGGKSDCGGDLRSGVFRSTGSEKGLGFGIQEARLESGGVHRSGDVSKVASG